MEKQREAKPEAENQAAASQQPGPRVIVKKRKKRKYTKGTKRRQEFWLGRTRSFLRVSDAVAEGMVTFQKRNKKSARKKRDGQVRDFPKNLAFGLSDAIGELGKAPKDIAKKLRSRRRYKWARKWVRIWRW